MVLNSPGIGSGLDVKTLVSKLISASAQEPSLRFDRKEANLQAKISALGAIKSSLSDFQAALSGISDITGFSHKSVTNTQQQLFSVTANDQAASGHYSVNVSNLAQAQKLASKSFADTTSAIGTGTLTFSFGRHDTDLNTFDLNSEKTGGSVTIDSSNNSLQGIRDAVNEADIGVTATIINDGSGNRLVFSSDDTGEENSLRIITSSDGDASDTDDSGLSQLAYDPVAAGVGAGKNLEQTVSARDALLTIDGIDITSDSNSIEGAIQGVTLQLKEADADTTATITVAEDKKAVTTSIKNFVDAYNELIETSNKLSYYNQETGEAGVLLGDATLRSIMGQVRRLLADNVEGLDGPYTALINLGIKTQEGGKLNIDESKLGQALDQGVEEVAAVFAALGRSSDSLIKVNDFSSATQVDSYAVNISQLATRGEYTGTAVSSLTINADNDEFVLNVDGTTSETITLSHGTYASLADLVNEIQNQVNKDTTLNNAGRALTVTDNGTGLVFSSSQYGSESEVSIVSADVNTASELGFSESTGVSTSGVDVAGTIGGVTASGDGQVLTGNGDAEGLSITVSGGLTGDRGVIDFTRGIADRLDNLMSSLLDSEGVLSSRSKSLNNRVEDISLQRENLSERLAALESRYLAQFNAMDALVAQLQSTSNFLFQQLNSTPFAQMSN